MLILMEPSILHFIVSLLQAIRFCKPVVHTHNLFLKSIPYSQFLRLRRNCTLDADFHLAANDLSLRLHQRGYSRSLLNKAFNKVAKLNRKDLIHSKRPSKSNQSVHIITRFSKQHTQMRALLDKFWPLLTADNMINKYIKPFPEITYRWAPSMKDRLGN